MGFAFGDFEVIETEVVFQLAILLLDRPAAAGERDEIDERRRVRQVEQVVLLLVGRGSFSEQPPVAAPFRRPDAQRTEARGQWTCGACPPCHGLPRVLRGRLRNGRRGLRPRHADDRTHGFAANRDAIRESQALHAGTELRVAPVVRIDHHAGDREARVQNRAHLANAMRHFSRNWSVAGIPAAARRGASSVHDTGT